MSSMKGLIISQALGMMAGQGFMQHVGDLEPRSLDRRNPFDAHNREDLSQEPAIKSGERYDKAEAKRQRKNEIRLKSQNHE